MKHKRRTLEAFKCPKCNNPEQDVESFDMEEDEGHSEFIQPMRCHNCDSNYNNVYILAEQTYHVED